MTDTDARDFYADPENLQPAGPARALPRKALSSHVPIRFQPETIQRVRVFARHDRKTVSTWIRDLVEREVERRTLPATSTVGPGSVVEFVVAKGDSPRSSTPTLKISEREFQVTT